MDEVQCVCCNRDFEMPKRHTVRPDDIEFLCVPRLLDCVHTCCQSCLEDSWQKSGDEKTVTCPICNFQKRVEGTAFLPLNGAVLQKILPEDGDIPDTCSRCHDDVASFSWCSHCSVALCEFHHQDHKLSVNTKTHDTQTIAELGHKKTKIVHRLPPIPCPHDSARDSTVFCHVCGYLCSAEAMMFQHRDHDYTEATALIDPSRKLLEESRCDCEQLAEDVEAVAATVQGALANLNKDTNECALIIENTFQALRKTLAAREKALLTRLKSIADRKKGALNEQLEILRDLSGDCCELVDCADALIEAGCRPEDENGGIYMVNTAHCLKRRASSLRKEYDVIPKSPVVEPDIACRINQATCQSVNEMLRTFGWLGTTENTPAEEKERCQYAEEKSARMSDLGAKREGVPVDVGADSKITSADAIRIPLTISLALKSGPLPKLSSYNRAASSIEALTVEVRVECGNDTSDTAERKFDIDENVMDCGTDVNMSSKNNNFILTYDPAEKQRPRRMDIRSAGSNDSIDNGVVGQVFLITEVDKKIKKIETRSFFESLNESDTVPALRITKEVLQAAR